MSIGWLSGSASACSCSFQLSQNEETRPRPSRTRMSLAFKRPKDNAPRATTPASIKAGHKAGRGLYSSSSVVSGRPCRTRTKLLPPGSVLGQSRTRPVPMRAENSASRDVQPQLQFRRKYGFPGSNIVRFGGVAAYRRRHRSSHARAPVLRRRGQPVLGENPAVGAGRAPWAAAPERPTNNDGVPERPPAAAAATKAAARPRGADRRERLELLAAQFDLRARVRDPATMS